MLRCRRNPLVTTLKQAKRLIRIVVGFTLLLFGAIMLITPGPGIVTIALGLAILGTEFVWARRLMKRFKKEADHLRGSVFTGKR